MSSTATKMQPVKHRDTIKSKHRKYGTAKGYPAKLIALPDELWKAIDEYRANSQRGRAVVIEEILKPVLLPGENSR